MKRKPIVHCVINPLFWATAIAALILVMAPEKSAPSAQKPAPPATATATATALVAQR